MKPGASNMAPPTARISPSATSFAGSSPLLSRSFARNNVASPCWRNNQAPITAVRNTSPTVFSRSEEHTSELQSRPHLVCRLLLEKKKKDRNIYYAEKKKRYINDFYSTHTNLNF